MVQQQKLSRAQKMAIKIANAASFELSVASKNELLQYVSDNVHTLDSSDSFKAILFELYLDNLTNPKQDVTAIHLSTMFKLIANEKLSDAAKRLLVLDISPVENELLHFDERRTHDLMLNLAKLKEANLTYTLRICDAFHNNGEVMWFDPYKKGQYMSVKWSLSDYTVRDFETTCRMCSMAERSFTNYITDNII